MERETGIEPVTSSLVTCRSTAELLPLNFARLPPPLLQNNLPATTLSVFASSAQESWRENSGKRSEKSLGKHWPEDSSPAQPVSSLQTTALSATPAPPANLPDEFPSPPQSTISTPHPVQASLQHIHAAPRDRMPWFPSSGETAALHRNAAPLPPVYRSPACPLQPPATPAPEPPFPRLLPGAAPSSAQP